MRSNLVTIKTFANPIEAHIAKAKLDDAEIFCYLKDENLYAYKPYYSNLSGGIELQVTNQDLPVAIQLLHLTQSVQPVCPNCNSYNVRLREVKKEKFTRLKIIVELLVGNTPLPSYVIKTYKCDQCSNEFKLSDRLDF